MKSSEGIEGEKACRENATRRVRDRVPSGGKQQLSDAIESLCIECSIILQSSAPRITAP